MSSEHKLVLSKSARVGDEQTGAQKSCKLLLLEGGNLGERPVMMTYKQDSVAMLSKSQSEA